MVREATRKLVQLDTPNTMCMNWAFFDMISGRSSRDFVEIGPGLGQLSSALCDMGMTGTGVDRSDAAIDALTQRMSPYVQRQQYSIVQADILEDSLDIRADLVFSMLVMEHVEDDILFLDRLKNLTRAGGMVVLAVPGRRDKWCIDDELYGHYRRYDRADLINLLTQGGWSDPKAWSLAVPVSNALFGLTNSITRRSHARRRLELPLHERTDVSGLKDIPYKNLFPDWCKYVINGRVMRPIHWLQRFFYHSNLGLTMIASGVNR